MPPGDQQLRIRRLRRTELPVDSVELARFLLGKIVVHEVRGARLSGRIVETEAYPPGDAAAHHSIGRTARNASLFLRPGHAYVYFTYGSCFLFNVSSELAGTGGGVLIRGIEPLEGIAQMERNRGTAVLRDLTRGPGRIAEAFAIDKRHDGLDLCAPGKLWLGELRTQDARLRGEIGNSVRIGITRAAHRRLRFYERGNRFVSGPQHLSPHAKRR